MTRLESRCQARFSLLLFKKRVDMLQDSGVRLFASWRLPSAVGSPSEQSPVGDVTMAIDTDGSNSVMPTVLLTASIPGYRALRGTDILLVECRHDDEECHQG